ncbi:MAG: hypothetical protein AAF570_22005, partial [Bacteroidota bacterium]
LLNLILEDPDFEGADDHLYESGIPMPPAEAQPAEGSIKASEFLSERWRERIRIERKFRKFWASGTAESPRADIEDSTLMYEALKRMTDPEELPLMMNDLQEEGLVDEQRKYELEERLEAMLQTAPLSDWYGENLEVRRAAEIFTPTGKVYAPDRVITKGEKAILVDFEDGGRKVSDPKQLRQYAKSLRALGYGEVEIWVYRLPEGSGEKVG